MSGVCHYCKRGLQRRGRLCATRDHIVPKHMGGAETVACCWHCNNMKGPMHIDAWRAAMARYPDWWKRFAHHGELLQAMRNDRWQEHRRRQSVGKWPRSVSVPRPSLCRGLPRSVAA